MADIFREVDEMMKQERLEKFWRENKIWIIAFIALSIIGTAGISIYKSWDIAVKEEQTAQLLTAFEDPKFPEGIEEIAADFRPALRGIALLSAAQTEQDKENNTPAALEIYNNMAQDSSIPSEFRDMAVLMQTRLDSAMSVDDKLAQLLNIQNDASSPWRHHANLESALIHANEKQDYAAARLQLDEIIKANPPAPMTLASKAKALEQLYSIKQDNKSAGETTPSSDTTTDEDS